MKEGEPVLGGDQANPGGIQSSNFGAQPISSATPQPISQPTPQPTPQPISQPTPQAPPQPTPQPIQPDITQPTTPPIPPATPQFNTEPIISQPISQPTPQFPSGPLSSGTGDIVLSSPQPQKSKKTPIIILIVVLLLVAIGLGVYFFFFNSNTTNSAMNNLFNRYANYLLYETESDTPISDDAWTSDKTSEILSLDTTAKNAYFSNLSTLYDNFYTSFKENNPESQDDKNTELEITHNFANNIKVSLQNITTYINLPNITTDDMANMYLNEGGENMINYVSNAYSEASSSINGGISEYGSSKIEIAKIIASMYDEYISLGCIKNQELDQNCVESANFSDNYNENQANLQGYLSELDDIDWHMSNDIVSMSYTLRELLDSMEENNND